MSPQRHKAIQKVKSTVFEALLRDTGEVVRQVVDAALCVRRAIGPLIIASRRGLQSTAFRYSHAPPRSTAYFRARLFAWPGRSASRMPRNAVASMRLVENPHLFARRTAPF